MNSLKNGSIRVLPLALVCLGAISAFGELIPAARLTSWTPGVRTGVIGGIPTTRTHLRNVTQPPYNADNTGATNASAAIQAAINAAVAEDIVYLPAGTYRLDSALTIGATKDNITVRGAGMAQTIIDCRTANWAITVGSGSDYTWAWPTSGNTITAGLAKDSTTLTIANTSAFSVGQMVHIAFQNQWDNTAIQSGAVPIATTGSYRGVRAQMSQVTRKTSTTLTISPGIYHAPDAGLSAQVNVAQFQTDRVGIEDMTIRNTKGTTFAAMNFEQCQGCWIKNVKSVDTTNYHVFFSNCLHCEVRHCVFDSRLGSGSNGSGLLVNSVSASLFEDNIITRMFPCVEVNFGSCGNVFAYNLFEDSRISGTLGVALDSNHGPHNSFNLYEGNVTPNIQADGYFGSVSEDTVFRNWIHGSVLSETIEGFMVSLNRFCRKYSVVGNIFGKSTTTISSPYSFGNPNMGNSSYTRTAQPSVGRFWADWNAMKAASPGAGPGSAAFQEEDLDVQPSTVLKGNYFVKTATLLESLNGDALPDSLFRTSKPSYFASLTWPPFNPLSPGTLAYDKIPAGYRYVHGTDPPGGTGAPQHLKIF